MYLSHRLWQSRYWHTYLCLEIIYPFSGHCANSTKFQVMEVGNFRGHRLDNVIPYGSVPSDQIVLGSNQNDLVLPESFLNIPREIHSCFLLGIVPSCIVNSSSYQDYLWDMSVTIKCRNVAFSDVQLRLRILASIFNNLTVLEVSLYTSRACESRDLLGYSQDLSCHSVVALNSL